MTEPETQRDNPLALPVEQMRELAHLVADLVVDHLEELRELPALRKETPEHLFSVLAGPLPEQPGDPAADLRLLADEALTAMQYANHPRYFARVPGPASFPGVLGDWLGIGFQAMASSWVGGAGPVAAELTAMGWMAEMIGLPAHTQGVVMSGGSMANLTALLAARAELGEGQVYLSDQTHSSIRRGLEVCGFHPEQLVTVDTGVALRLGVPEVRAAVEADIAAGRRPTMVVATAGATNTGAVDDIAGLRELCDEHGMWLHVDGAYGGPGAMTERGRAQTGDLSRVDSLVIDPHKWLFQPYDAGCVFVTRPGVLERTYTMNPEYLVDVTSTGGEVDLRNRSLELSRRARGLKLWLTIRTYGAEKLRRAIDCGIENAELAESMLREDSFWEVVTPAQLGVVTFAAVGIEEDAHRAAADSLTDSGWATLTTTTLNGRLVLRLCLINPGTTEADIRGTLQRLRALLEG